MALEANDIPAPRQDSGANAQNSELYRQISREDEEGPVIKKKRKSILVDLMASIMRGVLYVDSVRRSNELLFRRLNMLWGIFMGLLYLSGILMIVFSIYNRLQLPYYLESQLKERQIQFESAEYDMDRIEVHNLKGPDGLYTVDTLIVRTTFSDLLQRRIRSVIVDGLTIYLDAQPDFDPVQDIPTILSQLQHPTRGETKLIINALMVNNAKLMFDKKQMTIPLSFSVEGTYEDTTQISIPVRFERPFLMFQGVLTISRANGQPEWVLKITKGNVTLPRRAPEDFVGEVKVTLNDRKLNTVKGNFQLGSGTIKKEIVADFHQEAEKSLTGTISWRRNNVTEPELSSDLSVHIPYLYFSAKEPLQTRGTLTFDSKQFNLYNVSFKNLHAELEGELGCRSWKECSLNLSDESEIEFPEFQFEYQRQRFKTNESLRFTLLPQPLSASMDATQPDVRLSVNVRLKDLLFSGVNIDTQEKLDIKSAKTSLYALRADSPRVLAAFEGLDYSSATTSFKQANLELTDALQSTGQIKMRARDMILVDQPLLSQPFDINFNMVGSQAAARLKFKDQPLLIGIEGNLSLLQQNFSGKVNIRPFDLKDLTVPAHKLWPSIPETVKDLRGKVAIQGMLTWNSGHASGNPLYVGLKDVSFDMGDTKIEGMNGVLAVESLMPLTTKANQHVFVQKVQSLIPIQDVDAQFQMEAQGLKINQMLASVASVPLMVPPSVITAKNNGAVVYLKNAQSADLKQVQKFLNLPGMTLMSGSASVSIPIEMKDNLLNIPNVTLKVQDTQVNWNGAAPSAAFGPSSGYMIRHGQVIVDQDKTMQMTLNGRLLPSRAAKEIQLQQIPMPTNLIMDLPKKAVPKDIAGRQNVLFKNEAQ